MEYRKQLQSFVDYFKSSEKNRAEEAIGVEVEHFIVWATDLQAVNYSESEGIAAILQRLLEQGWQGQNEGDFLVQLSKEEKIITLEPGGQLEVSINPQQQISDLANIYRSFLADIIPILNANDQLLLTTGCQVESKLEEIEWTPKARYRIMSRYLAKRGKYAHHMMKASAALQVAIDYRSEADFIKKFKIANSLSPIISVLSDNSPFFVGQRYEQHAARTLIWSNCDDERCGVVEEAFSDHFGYQKYAEYILKRRPILLNEGNEFKFTGEQTCREIFANEGMSSANLEHVLTMFFPEVRAKNFIELRMMDTLPPELLWGIVAFWKGLLYDEENLQEVYELVKDWSYAEAEQVRADIIKEGLEAELRGQTFLELGRKLFEISARGLSAEELEYLADFKELITSGQNPVAVTRESLEAGNDKKRALEWLTLNRKL
ncbi:glutamate--cysteine ligase [Fuchsiella alkaliacetigena]|uniref:glutamate--cysteine ligase n=1 Tax=Fuchsiella alkaliacetigena TaxID=957042 RepID=UPI00200B563C|nr:glutamate-cysteine ligase family protein [Fuchsiella alkaliacetigena]MCK8823733.1 glutamate-cysteine ligase family protein [Fuchsiella alkaliacetigena]